MGKKGKKGKKAAAAAAAAPKVAEKKKSARVPVLFIPEIHHNLEVITRNTRFLSSYIRTKQTQHGVRRICFVSEGNSVNPVFDSLIAQVPPGGVSPTVEYIKRNLLVEALNSEQYNLEFSGQRVTTLPTTMNPLVDFVTQFFQDYGVLTYQMGDANTVEGFRAGMAHSGINHVDSWFEEGNNVMIQHLTESRQKGLLDDEGNAAADKAIAIIQTFRAGGLQGFYGESGENYATNIGILAQLLDLIKTMIIHSTEDSFDSTGKGLLPSFIDKIKHGLENGIANPEKMADEKDGLNAWRAIYLPNNSGERAGQIKPFMLLINSARDVNIINAMISRLNRSDPPQVFVMIFGKGHYPSIEKKMRDNPFLVLDPQSTALYNSMRGGKKTRRRRKGKKKKKTKKRRTKRRKSKKSRRKSRKSKRTRKKK